MIDGARAVAHLAVDLHVDLVGGAGRQAIGATLDGACRSLTAAFLPDFCKRVAGASASAWFLDQDTSLDQVIDVS